MITDRLGDKKFCYRLIITKKNRFNVIFLKLKNKIFLSSFFVAFLPVAEKRNPFESTRAMADTILTANVNLYHVTKFFP